MLEKFTVMGRFGARFRVSGYAVYIYCVCVCLAVLLKVCFWVL